MSDPYTEEQVTLARVGHAFAVVKAARELIADAPDDHVRWWGLTDAIANLDALDATEPK